MRLEARGGHRAPEPQPRRSRARLRVGAAGARAAHTPTAGSDLGFCPLFTPSCRTRAAAEQDTHSRRPISPIYRGAYISGDRPRAAPGSSRARQNQKLLLAKLREQRPDLALGNKEVREALAAEGRGRGGKAPEAGRTRSSMSPVAAAVQPFDQPPPPQPALEPPGAVASVVEEPCMLSSLPAVSSRSWPRPCASRTQCLTAVGPIPRLCGNSPCAWQRRRRAARRGTPLWWTQNLVQVDADPYLKPASRELAKAFTRGGARPTCHPWSWRYESTRRWRRWCIWLSSAPANRIYIDDEDLQQAVEAGAFEAVAEAMLAHPQAGRQAWDLQYDGCMPCAAASRARRVRRCCSCDPNLALALALRRWLAVSARRRRGYSRLWWRRCGRTQWVTHH